MSRSLLTRSSLRHGTRHPWQLALSVLGIALGVAVVVAVDMATGSARRAFQYATESVAGRATHEVTAGPAGIPDSVYATLRTELGLREAAPVVQGWARIPAAGRVFTLLGVDPFAEAPFRERHAAEASSFEGGGLLAAERSIVMAAATARELQVSVGDTVELEIAGRLQAVTLAGLLEAEDELSRRGLMDVLVADIAWAQVLLERVGRLDRIELRLPADEAARDALTIQIAAVLPEGVRLTPAGGDAAATANMTRAFETNLLALSLLALIFGMFLIYNTMTFSVVQRRSLIGLWRALGVTRREVFALLMLEAVLLGAVAGAIGVLGGAALGRGLVGLVVRTINDLYFTVRVTTVEFPAATILKGLALGVVATLVAAFPAIREATSAPPRAALTRSAIEESARRNVGRAAVGGVLLLGAAFLSLAVPSRSLLLGLASLFGFILAGALLAPGAALLLFRAVRPLAGRAFGQLGRMAAGGFGATLSRTGPALAALMVAVSVAVGVGVMIGSFRQTVVDWLATTLVADVYVSRPGEGSRGADAPLDTAFIRSVGTLTGVDAVSTYRNAAVPYGGVNVRLAAVDLAGVHHDAFDFLEREENVWQRFEREPVVLASEAFAWRNGLGAGDTVSITTAAGDLPFRIGGVFYDYASEHGVLFISANTYARYWNDHTVTSLGVFVRDGTEPDAIVAAIRATAAGGPDLVIRSNRGLRDATLRVFDQTFAITAVLRVLALIVAFVGILSALMALQLERARELAVLRATGFTPREVTALISAQTSLLGLAAGLLSVPLGLLLAWGLVHVVNRRSFGWTIVMEIDPGLLAQAIAVAFSAAAVASLYPAWRMGRTPAAAALREE